MKKTVAVITMCRNETDLLPLWINYYGSLFGNENLYVIDDGSEDGSTNDWRIQNIIKRQPGVFDDGLRAVIISVLQRHLLRLYDYVIVTDTDDIIVANPNIATDLKQYLDGTNLDYITAVGLNIIQNLKTESTLDISNELFEQRKHVQFHIGGCKTLISKIALRFEPGFHYSGVSPNFDENLYLFSLHNADYTIAKRRHEQRARVVISDASIRNKMGFTDQQPKFGIHWQKPWSEASMDFYSNEQNFSLNDTDFSFDAAREWCRTGGAGKNGYNGKFALIPGNFKNIKNLCNTSFMHGDNFHSGREKNVCNRLPSIWEAVIQDVVNMRILKFTRNSLCLCGSGLRFKACHGKIF